MSTAVATAPAGPVPGARSLRRRLPAACWACVLLALTNGVIWDLVNPAMQGPDEAAHIAYVEYFAQHGQPPSLRPGPAPTRGAPAGNALLSPEWNDINLTLPFSPVGTNTFSPVEDRDLRIRGRTDSRVQNNSGVNYVAITPPLYYAMAAVVDKAVSGHSALDRLFWMRLVGALFAAATTLFCFLFVRELLPGHPLAWTVGGLAAAFQPVLGFMAGSVSGDNALFATSAALFFILARIHRLGLTPRRGVALGVIGFAGALSKGTFFGLVPGAFLAVMIMLWRQRSSSRPAVVGTAMAAAIAGVPFAIWQYANSNSLGRSGAATAGLTSHAFQQITSLKGQLSYVWQTFLPVLPFMHHHYFTQFSHYPLWFVYIQGFIGRFGWFAFGFHGWVNWFGLGVIVSMLAAAAYGLRRSDRASRWLELLVYVVMGIGTVLVVAYAGYRYKLTAGADFEQTRYLMGLLPLWAGLAGVSTIALERRWRPTAAGVLVTVFVCDSIGSLLLVVGHAYAFSTL